jgi:hypothetical protein
MFVKLPREQKFIRVEDILSITAAHNQYPCLNIVYKTISDDYILKDRNCPVLSSSSYNTIEEREIALNDFLKKLEKYVPVIQ